MTLGDILTEVTNKDMAGGKKFSLVYEEKIVDDKFKIRLFSETDPDAYIHCSVPYDGSEGAENYARAYFLSMVFNAAIFGIKRKKKIDKIKPSN